MSMRALPAGSAATGVKVLAKREGTLLMVDTYNSLPGGMSYRQAGEESFLRVVSTTSGTPEETTRVKLSSCRQNIELGASGLEWRPGSLMSFWAHPERVLDVAARNATSGFARMPVDIVERVVAAVGRDLQNGTWERRHGHLRQMSEYDAGLRLLINTPD
jgi:hypothetical protein